MNKRFLINAFVWGFLLWLIGYVIGILLFAIVPANLIGWIIMPIGILLTMWVLLKKTPSSFTNSFVILALIWTTIAIACDYFFLVKLFNPVDGYYKLDVYVYYALTFLLPLLVGWKKSK